MLVVETDERGHIDRDPDYKRKRQKELGKLGDHLIWINPDKIDFKNYEEFGRVCAYIAESVKKQTEKPTKKSLINDLSKILLELEFKSNHPIKSKCLKCTGKKILPHNIRDEKHAIKNKTDKNWKRNWVSVLFRV